MDSYLQQLVAKRSQMSSPSALMNAIPDNPAPEMGNTSPPPDVNSMMPPTNVQAAPQPVQQSISGATEMAHGWKGLLANFMQGMGDAMLKNAGLPTSYEKQIYAQKVADKAADDEFTHSMSMAELHEKIRSNQAQEAQTSAVQQQNEMIRLFGIGEANKRSADNLDERKAEHADNTQLRQQGLDQNRTFQQGMLQLRADIAKNKSQPTVVIQTTDGQGNPISKIVPKVAGAEYASAATAPTRSMRETAPKVVDLTNKIDKEIDGVANGPTSGRWNELWSGTVGQPNAAFTTLKTDDKLLSSLLVKMHIGARGAQEITKQFRDMVNEGKQSPENLHAAVAAIRDYATSIQYPSGESGRTPKASTAEEYLKKF